MPILKGKEKAGQAAAEGGGAMFQGKLVRLRAFEQSDLEVSHGFVNDEQTLLDMFSGLPLPSSLEDERRWIEQQSSYTRGEYQFAVENHEGLLVGRCGLTRVDWKNRVGELGIMIGAPYRGRGYGTEAMGLVCAFAFGEMNLHKLKVHVLAGNAPALRCYEKCGFVREGLLRGEVFRGGGYQDVAALARFAPQDFSREAD